MKKNILFLVIGMIIATGIGAIANTMISADKIEYKDNTVAGALDDLYTEANKDILGKLNLSSSKTGYSVSYGDKQTRTVSLNLSAGSYLIIGTASYGIHNNSMTSENGQTEYPKPTNMAGCTFINGKMTKGVSSKTLNNNKLVQATMSSIYVCKFTTNTTLTLTTENWSSINTEVSSIMAASIKLD